MRSIIFNQAGDITLVRYNTDGTLTLTDASKYVGANGTVESIKSNIEVTTSDLPDGNSDWPMGPYDTGKKGSIEVAMSSFQPNLYAALMGVSRVAESAQNMWATNEAKTISATPFAVTLENVVVAGGNIVVLDNSGSPLVSVASGPAASQYTVAGAVLTFNSADTGKAVYATYQYASLTSERVSLPSFGIRPALYAIIAGKAMSEDQTTTFDFNLLVDKCKATGALTKPDQQRQPAAWKFTLQVMKPRSGFNAVDNRFKLT